MINVKNATIITVSTNKIIPIATEPKFKKVAILKNGKGEIVELKTHQLTKELIQFLENSGLSVEHGNAPDGCKGKTEIGGVPVKVSPIAHTNYDSGAIIKVPENSDLDLDNTRKVLKTLRKAGIDIQRYCQVSEKGTSCLSKLGD